MMNAIDKEMLHTLRKPIIDIGKDLFRDNNGQPNPSQHYDHHKAIQAKNYFNSITDEDLFKEILDKDYQKYFLDGFCLADFDSNMQYLTINEKAKLLEKVVEALDLDL